jgi:very-short-patch-repair endonuclease
VEIDGMRAHISPEAFRQDRSKQNRLINAGYRGLRFTWWDLTQRPDRVIPQVREALAIAMRGPF